MWVNKYVGMRYLPGGEAPFRCWNLVVLVYKEQLGIELPDYGAVSSRALMKIAKAFEEGKREGGDWTQIPADQVREFDLFLMQAPTKIRGVVRNVERHIGIVVRGRRILHAEDTVDTVCVPLDHRNVRFRLTEAYRHRLAP